MVTFDWEIAYIDLDESRLVLRLTQTSWWLIPMIIFDACQMQGWAKGDTIASDPGPLSSVRDMQRKMGLPMSEEDYTLTNKRTRGSALIRKDDYECEDALVWLKGLQANGLV